jgi:ribonucleoside-diphosphate reductase beta chain
MTILNLKNVDTTTQPLFLGEELGLQRYDRFKYKVFFDLFNKQLTCFWRPEEINLSLDRVDYGNLQEHEKFIFTKNLLFQTMLDSVVARGVPVFAKYVSNPELEICLNTWGFFENIHSYSYTYVIKNVYSNPSEVLDQALNDKEILKRAENVVKSYDELNAAKLNLKEQIYLSLISVNILEGIRFYVSFVCAFAFGENKKMIGNSEIIKLIRRDEAIHMYNTQTILNILKNEPSEGFQETVKNVQDVAIKLFLDAAQEEKEWASYLFQHGSIMGLNATILHQYIEWLTDSRMKELGLPEQFGSKNPIKGWVEPWMNSGLIQVAPQETEITSYKISASKNDIGNEDFEIEL